MIPPMTHPLSSGWQQPDHSKFLFDDTHVTMDEQSFNALKEYNHSTPSGVYEGKMWKRKDHGQDGYLLVWFDTHPTNPDLCQFNQRKILIV